MPASSDSATAAASARQVIALVDDDRNILTTVSIALQAEGFATRVYTDGQAALRALLDNPPDLAIFDIKMPKLDGFTLLEQLRAQSSLPVIFLTSKDEEPDEARGLALGADDYIAKPFSPRELQARIKALLRRAEFRQPEKEKEPSRRLRFAEWTLDTLSHQLTHEDGSLLDLSGSDALLLGMFLQQPGVVLDRDTISDATRGRESLPMERGIDVQISRLRQKLGDNGKSPRIIKTIRGSGYMLIAEVHEIP